MTDVLTRRAVLYLNKRSCVRCANWSCAPTPRQWKVFQCRMELVSSEVFSVFQGNEFEADSLKQTSRFTYFLERASCGPRPKQPEFLFFWAFVWARSFVNVRRHLDFFMIFWTHSTRSTVPNPHTDLVSWGMSTKPAVVITYRSASCHWLVDRKQSTIRALFSFEFVSQLCCFLFFIVDSFIISVFDLSPQASHYEIAQ